MNQACKYRVGFGYDVHRLVSNRKLIIGGVEIPFEQGLLGHSDADVLCHAICDALLGAAAMGDIGIHFPDTDPQYKDISSLKLLKQCVNIIQAAHYAIGNIDCTIIAQAPRMAPYIHQMRTTLTDVLAVTIDQINIKATTTEKLGCIGAGEGIAAHCVAMLFGQIYKQ
ncbi:MAG: 2-C-methyl-D-erythritol 2,4-cyclodiphosphate synthase [Candidatus Magnetomorum sp.]|nr:2-C-methyl-D-erythritol 2,4-cyclodiphosphate synthase [Candidatus Magnetomorum sp.]